MLHVVVTVCVLIDDNDGTVAVPTAATVLLRVVVRRRVEDGVDPVASATSLLGTGRRFGIS